MGELLGNNRFEILQPSELRSAVIDRGKALCEIIHDGSYDQLLFLGDGAVPLLALFHCQWAGLISQQKHPPVEILNIGIEKQILLRNYCKPILPDFDFNFNSTSYLFSLTDRDVVQQVYGPDADELLASVFGNVEKKILIVDDIHAGGGTGRFIKKLRNIYNPKVRLDYFYFFNDGTPDDTDYDEEVVDIDWDFEIEEIPWSYRLSSENIDYDLNSKLKCTTR